MKRVLFACLIACLGLSLAGATASAAGPEQRPDGKFLRHGHTVRVVAQVLQMTPRGLWHELRQGATVAELAEEKGVALSEVDAAIALPYRERIAEDVAAGVLNQAQADYLLTRAEERRYAFLTLRPRQALLQPLLEPFAEVLGIREADIVARIAGGESPAEIVASSGQQVDTIISEMVAVRASELQEQVTLDLITQTQKNRLLRLYERRLTALLTP